MDLSAFWQGVYSKKKEFGSKFFPFRVDHLSEGMLKGSKFFPYKVYRGENSFLFVRTPFQKGGKKKFDRVTSLERHPFPISKELLYSYFTHVAGLGGSEACPTGDQEVAGSIPAGSATFFHGYLVNHLED